jgi:DNA-binding response OmpR family regulator
LKSALATNRVLVAEDELLVSMLIEDFTNVSDALAAAQNEPVDVALLDVNLRGENVFPVATELTNRGIPFVFLSGYGRDAIGSDCVCSKPFNANDLTKMLIERMEGSR